MKYFFLFIAVVILFNCKPEKEEPKPLTAPVLTTMEAGDITAISALSGGAISSDGGSPVTARGIVWSISHNPTLADSVSEEGTGIGSFTSDLTPLKYSTTYYVRAYATNSIGTTYGNEVTFNTKAAVPSDGLVGWWPFNGNANDESGNGLNGDYKGQDLVFGHDRFNIQEAAYSATGNGYFDIGTAETMNFNGDFTISVWVKTDEQLINSGIFGRWNQGLNSVRGLEHYTLVFDATFGVAALIGLPILENKSSINFWDGGWHNYIMSLNGKDFKLFVDGQLSGTFLFDGNLNSVSQNFVIGAYSQEWYQDNNGKIRIIDDLSAWNRALTAEEIQKIYNGTGF